MLFNSYVFTFGFLPVVLIFYHVTHRFGAMAQRGVLLVASWVFYAWWDAQLLLLLLISIGMNYLIGCNIAANVRRASHTKAGAWTAVGIAFNIAIIGVFKYANFFVDSANAVLGTDYLIGAVILPLGISFYTFEQISFLVDSRTGKTVPADLLRYALFVSFFPRLIAGPILRYNEISPQWESRTGKGLSSDDLIVGMTIFFFGLVKKAVLADGIAPYVSPGFDLAANGGAVDFFAAWGSVLAYTFQLYFDFSGYSDMAIGLARCFGIRFPVNFFSPYKATSIIEFWQRWHITLSRFLRDYLYIKLGGNRRGETRRYLNLIITMLLGGLWHGANWTFVLWGGLHGAYLVINHGWRRVAARNAWLQRFGESSVGKVFGWALTFFAVVVAWVFFRADSFQASWAMLQGMAGMNGAVLPAGLAFAARPFVGPLLDFFGIGFGAGSGTNFVLTYLWVAGLFALALLAPNTQQLMSDYRPVIDPLPVGKRSWIRWSYSPRWAAITAGAAFLGLSSLTRVSEFLYWQF